MSELISSSQPCYKESVMITNLLLWMRKLHEGVWRFSKIISQSQETGPLAWICFIAFNSFFPTSTLTSQLPGHGWATSSIWSRAEDNGAGKTISVIRISLPRSSGRWHVLQAMKSQDSRLCAVFGHWVWTYCIPENHSTTTNHASRLLIKRNGV
jgi:hypothetical protein